jgi:hypothetical protein
MQLTHIAGASDRSIAPGGAASCTPLRTLATGGDVNSSPALGNKMVYVGSDDGRLHAFGLAS